MPIFEWNPSYELGIEQIDGQHKELVRMINDLYDSIKGRDSAEVVNRTLAQLLQYVEVHFDTEERAMQERGYPEFSEHHKLHEDLRRKVFDLKKSQLQGVDIATFELLNFLTDWLKEHIAYEDKLFGDFVNKMERSNLV
jgi:hemerythrin